MTTKYKFSEFEMVKRFQSKIGAVRGFRVVHRSWVLRENQLVATWGT